MTTGTKNEKPSPIEVHPTALALAGASLALLGWLAPSGLFLFGFLGLIIITHEAGHFLAARAAGMAPSEFFWGFGPEVVSVRYKGCRFGIKALFIGGYVKLEGMTPESELPSGFREADTYRAASLGGRLATILAGPAVNLVSAVGAATGAAMMSGASISVALRGALTMVAEIAWITLASLGALVANLVTYLQAVFGDTGAAPVRFLSPVGQAQVSGQAVDAGLQTSLYWFAILACAVGVVNLIPFPPLDGAHALAAVLEWGRRRLTGRRAMVNVARWVPAAYVTVGLLVLLSVTALIMDLRDLAVAS